MFDFFLDLVRTLVAKEPARLVGYGSALAVAGALKLGELLGVTLSVEAIAGVSAIAAFVMTELIRRFVFAPATVDMIAAEAASSGSSAVGPPPAG